MPLKSARGAQKRTTSQSQPHHEESNPHLFKACQPCTSAAAASAALPTHAPSRSSFTQRSFTQRSFTQRSFTQRSFTQRSFTHASRLARIPSRNPGPSPGTLGTHHATMAGPPLDTLSPNSNHGSSHVEPARRALAPEGVDADLPQRHPRLRRGLAPEEGAAHQAARHPAAQVSRHLLLAGQRDSDDAVLRVL